MRDVVRDRCIGGLGPIVPELVRRGRVQTSYRQETLREKLTDAPSPVVEHTHPAAHYRGAYAGAESVADNTLPTRFEHDQRAVAAE